MTTKMNNTQKKARAQKTTREQYLLYLNELESNVAFRENTFSPKEDPDILDKTWENLVRKLNCTGGLAKDVPGWKHVFSDWKCQTRKKARQNQQAYKETGNKGADIKSLTDLENKLLDLTGRVVVTGMKVEEIGLNTKRVLPSDVEENSDMDEELTLLDEPAQHGPPPGKVPSAKKVRAASTEPHSIARTRKTPTSATKSLSKSLAELIALRKQNNANEETGIDKKLTELINIEKERLQVDKEKLQLEKEKVQIEKMELRLKYPDIELVSEQEEDDENETAHDESD